MSQNQRKRVRRGKWLAALSKVRTERHPLDSLTWRHLVSSKEKKSYQMDIENVQLHVKFDFEGE